MGGAKKAIDQVKKSVESGVADVGKGLEQIAQGNVEQGLLNTTVGQFNATGGGSLLAAGGKGIKGQTMEENAAKANADYEEATAASDARDAATAKETDRTTKIKNRLNEEIKLRQRQPGRAQTLLTTGMTPSASQTNTLLTSASRSMGQ